MFSRRSFRAEHVIPLQCGTTALGHFGQWCIPHWLFLCDFRTIKVLELLSFDHCLGLVTKIDSDCCQLNHFQHTRPNGLQTAFARSTTIALCDFCQLAAHVAPQGKVLQAACCFEVHWLPSWYVLIKRTISSVEIALEEDMLYVIWEQVLSANVSCALLVSNGKRDPCTLSHVNYPDVWE
jgi:hypothetical protein